MKKLLLLLSVCMILCACDRPSDRVYNNTKPMVVYSATTTGGSSCGKYRYYINDDASNWELCTDYKYDVGDILIITKTDRGVRP